MVNHVRKDFRFPDILEVESGKLRSPTTRLRKSINPGVLVMGTLLLVGLIVGYKALMGVLIDALWCTLVSGVCGAINSKYIKQDKMTNKDDGKLTNKGGRCSCRRYCIR